MSSSFPPQKARFLVRARYRLTNRGYGFLEILNEKTVFNKVKNFSLSTALDVGKSLLIAALTSGVSG